MDDDQQLNPIDFPERMPTLFAIDNTVTLAKLFANMRIAVVKLTLCRVQLRAVFSGFQSNCVARADVTTKM